MDPKSTPKDATIHQIEVLCENCEQRILLWNGSLQIVSESKPNPKSAKFLRGTRKNMKKLYVADLCKNGELPRGLVKIKSRKNRLKSVKYSCLTPQPARISPNRESPNQERTYLSPIRDNSNLNLSSISGGKTFFKKSTEGDLFALDLQQIKLSRDLMDQEADLGYILELSDLKSTARTEEKFNVHSDFSPLSIDTENHAAKNLFGQFVKNENFSTKKFKEERLKAPLQELGLSSLCSLSSGSLRW